MATKKKMNLRQARKLITNLIHAAEDMFESGKDRKAWVVEQINKKVDLPFLTEGQEAILLGLIIDVIVDVLNDQGILSGGKHGGGIIAAVAG